MADGIYNARNKGVQNDNFMPKIVSFAKLYKTYLVANMETVKSGMARLL